MRTTLTIDDDVLETARELAEDWNKPLGEVLSELARRGIRGPARMERDPVTGWMIIKSPPGSPKITSEMVYEALANEDLDKYLPKKKR